MMTHEESCGICQGIAVQDLPSLGIIDRRRIQRNPEIFYRIKGPPVGEPVLAGKLNRFDVSSGQLRCFGLRFGLCLVQIPEIQPLTLAAKMINDPKIIARRLRVSVDFHGGRTRLHREGKGVSSWCFISDDFTMRNCVNNVRKVSEIASYFLA